MSALWALLLTLQVAFAQEPAVHADAHWNQGVQALELGREDLAILSFRRGLLLRPHDPGLRAQLAQRQALPERPPLLAPDRWGAVGVAAVGLSLLGLLLWRVRRRKEALIAALLLGPVGAALAVQAQAQVSSWGEEALVLAPGATLTSQPDGGLELFTLPPTSEVRLGPISGDSVQVVTRDGRRGWTSLDALGVLDPRVFTSFSL